MTALQTPAPSSSPGGLEPPEPDAVGYLNAMVIPITNRWGDVIASTIVDPELYPALSLWSWGLTDRGYIARSRWLSNGKTETVRMHRAIMCLTAGDGLEVDHLNRNPLDNRRANLRIATTAENLANRLPRRRNYVPLTQREMEANTCWNGHSRAEHTRIDRSGKRYCRECKRTATYHRQPPKRLPEYRLLTRVEGLSPQEAQQRMGIGRTTRQRMEAALRDEVSS